MVEEWKDIVGYEGLYQISNFGNVKTLPKPGGYKSERLLKSSKDTCGYFQVCLTKQYKKWTVSIHRLVARHFLPKKKTPEYEVNHIDGNKLNNQVTNLEWVTKIENNKHAGVHGLKAWGRRHHCVKLTENQVRTIRDLFSNGILRTALARMYEVNYGTIYCIVQGRTWKHLL